MENKPVRILIHACPKRMWYVNDFLIPMLTDQGARTNEILLWNDSGGRGNLISCMEAFASLPFDGETWHIQDDVLPCRDFMARIRAHPGGPAYGFCCRTFFDDVRNAGRVYAADAWHSFQCVCIPDAWARDCAEWFFSGAWERSSWDIDLPTLRKIGKGDDSFFREYLMQKHGTETVTNYAPNLVEHVDWLIGGSSLGHWNDRIIRSGRWEDEDLVTELRQRLRERRQTN